MIVRIKLLGIINEFFSNGFCQGATGGATRISTARTTVGATRICTSRTTGGETRKCTARTTGGTTSSCTTRTKGGAMGRTAEERTMGRRMEKSEKPRTRNCVAEERCPRACNGE